MGLIDRDNLVAVLWAVLYGFALILLLGALDSLGMTPSIGVPIGVIVLPILIGLALVPVDRALGGRHG